MCDYQLTALWRSEKARLSLGDWRASSSITDSFTKRKAAGTNVSGLLHSRM